MHYDIVILGYGPVAAVAVNMLAQRGWNVAVVERMPDVYPLPRAIAFDGETFRTFQELGLDGEISRSTTGSQGAEFLDGDGNRIIGFDLPEGALGACRHPDTSYFHQPTLEKTLRRNAAGFSNVTVLLEHEAGMPNQNAERVSVNVTDIASGEQKTLTADYLIAADGASSQVRKGLGFKLESLGYDCQWLVVDATVKDRSGLPVTAQQHCDPKRIVTFVPGVNELVRWEIRSLPGESAEDMQNNDFIWSVIGRWVTPENASIERSAVYQFHGTTADFWSKDRIFLAGDAVHQTPPFLGQGMVAGIRDVVNLVWKLDRVKNGTAPASLLETYQPERKPHAHDLVSWAVEMGQLMDQIADAHTSGVFPADMKAAYGGNRGFPRLHCGVLALNENDASDGVTGYPSPQPLVAYNGAEPVLMDELIGPNFAILSATDVSNDLSEKHKALLERIGTTMLVLPESSRKSRELDALLGLHKAVILRPDRYVFGLVNNVHSMSEQLDKLAEHFL